AIAHCVVASAAIALFGIASSAQAAMLAPNFSDGMSTFTEPFEFITVQGLGNPDFKEFRYIITENSKVPSATPTCTTGTAIQPDSSGLGRPMFPPVIPPRTSRNMVTATISVIACGNTAGNESPVAWVWFEYNGPTVAQAGELAAPTLSEVSGSFNATFNLSVTQGAGSDTGEFKEFRYTKTSTTTPPAAPANCTLGTAVPSNGIISIAATTSISVIACGKTTGNKSSATTATYTLDKAPPTLVVTGPFGSDGTTALLLANSSSTIKYKLTFAGADDILSDNDLAAKITLSPLGIAGTVAVTGAGLTERVVTLTNVTGNGTAVKIAVGSGTASDFAGNQALANSTAKALVLDNTAPTISVKGPSIIHAKASSSVTYTVTYAGATNVTLAAGDISLSKPDGGGEALSATVAVTGTGNATRTITLSNFTSAASNARLGITIAAGTAADVIGNLAPAPSASIGTINVDTTAPTFTVSGPSQENAKATSIVTYTVTYSGATKAITLAPKDITINATGVGSAIAASATVKVTPDAGVGCKPGPCTVAPDPMKRFVTLSGFKSTGTLGIAIKTNSASDLAGNFAAAGIDSTTFNVDTGIPTIAVGDPSLPNAKADSTVNYTVYYHGVTGVTLANSHVTLIKTGTANASYEVSGTGDDGTVTRTVTLTGFTGNGTIK
ncbi:MAG: hypothetical protein EBU49_07495, partial [Proteobacteria bacterium]|nr:hypothetical protein [Pseudomonadota bacterium]